MDNVKRCSFCTCKRLQLSRAAYYSWSSYSRCLASHFSRLVIWHSLQIQQWMYTLKCCFRVRYVNMKAGLFFFKAFVLNLGCHHSRTCAFKFNFRKFISLKIKRWNYACCENPQSSSQSNWQMDRNLNGLIHICFRGKPNRNTLCCNWDSVLYKPRATWKWQLKYAGWTKVISKYLSPVFGGMQDKIQDQWNHFKAETVATRVMSAEVLTTARPA